MVILYIYLTCWHMKSMFYERQLLSNADLTLLGILTRVITWESLLGKIRAYIHALNCKSSASLKTSHPHRLPL
jgi:hypothetical protein